MTNHDLISKFFRGERCKHTLNRFSTNNELFSYDTVILHYDDINDKYYMNIEYYSFTTSKMQYEIMDFLTGKNVIYYYGKNYGQNYFDNDFQVIMQLEYQLDNGSKFIIAKVNNENKMYIKHGGHIYEIKRKIFYNKKIDNSFYIKYNNQKLYLKDFKIIDK